MKKFWCASSRRKSITKSNSSFSSSASYETISSIPPVAKSDSGYSEVSSSSSEVYRHLEQILGIERAHHENLKKYILKYSRPLRRYLNPTEIVDLFQNIEKISTISKSIVHQLNISNKSISIIYQSWFGIMIDSYSTYISRNLTAQQTLKQCCNKIGYFLQIPIDVVMHEVTEFIFLPLRHICVLNDVFQSYGFTTMTETMNYLSKQANYALQLSYNDQISTSDLSLQSDISPTTVLYRTEKEPWRSKHLELSDSELLFIELNQSSVNASIWLSNIVQIQEDLVNEEICLLVASDSRKSSRYSSLKIKRVYIRFDNRNDYSNWLNYLSNAIQNAKDQTWSKTNELII